MVEFFITLFILAVISIGLFVISEISRCKGMDELERSRKELDEKMQSIRLNITKDHRDKEIVDEVNDESWDETREEARNLVEGIPVLTPAELRAFAFNPYIPIQPPYPVQKQGKLVSLKCTNCGGALNPNTLICEYCHTPHTLI